MRKILLIIAINTLFAILATAQIGSLRRANMHYEKYDFAEAAELYEKFDASNPSDTIKAKIASCYYRMNKMNKVESWFRRVENMNALGSEDHYRFAQALLSDNKHEEALIWLKKCQIENPNDRRFSEKIAFVEHWQDNLEDSLQYTISTVNINSIENDFSPALYHEGILFCSSRKSGVNISNTYKWDNSAFIDIYYAEQENGVLLEPSTFNSAVNTKYHEGPMVINEVQSEIMFTRNNYMNSHTSKSEDHVTKMGLFYSEKTHDAEHGHGWHDVHPFLLNNKEYSVQHPAATANLDTLYFASDMPGGLGGEDLYIVYKNGDSWSKPKNLGYPINTEGNEVFPYLSKEGILFFSSDGHAGMGGLDVFKMEEEKVVNMGYPFNTSRDDFGIALNEDQKSGYLSSNREGGKGGDDIYYFTINKIKFNLLGMTYEQLRGDIKKDLLPITKVDIVVNGSILKTLTTDEQGNFSTEVKKGQVYTIIATKSEHESDTLLLDLTNKEGYEDEAVELVLPYSNLNLTVQVRDKNTDALLSQAHTYVLTKETGEIREFSTDSNGSLTFDVEAGKNYVIKSFKQSYFESGVNVSVPDSSFGALSIDPIYLKKEKVVNYKSYVVLFDFDKSDVLPKASVTLNEVIETYKKGGVTLEIGGHTDSRGSHAYNNALSSRRVNSVLHQLNKLGVKKADVGRKTFGETTLINHCKDGVDCSEELHDVNRRVEIRLVGAQNVTQVSGEESQMDLTATYDNFEKREVNK